MYLWQGEALSMP